MVTPKTTPASRVTAAKTALNNALPPPADKELATVVKQEHTTTTFHRPIKEDEIKDTSKTQTDTNNNSNNSSTNVNNEVNATIQQAQETPQAQIPRNRLADFFADLQDFESEDGEIFYALITRRGDMLNDNFRKPSLTPQSFPPLQITSKMLLQFVPIIQKYNGNSGGRFDIVVCDSENEMIDTGLTNFVIADPPIEPIAETSKEATDVLAIIEKLNEANREQTERLLTAIKPQEDEFTKMVKEKMRQDFINPPERKGFDTAEFMQQFMVMPATMSMFADAMSKAMNNNNGKEDKSLLESLLTNETFIGRASEVVENLTGNLTDIVIAMKNNGNPTPPPSLPNGYNEHNETQTEDDTAMQERRQIIETIIAELNTENPLDDSNAFLLQLKDDNPDIYNVLLISCKSLPFETLISQLQGLVPDAFTGLQNDDSTLNAKGLQLQSRLKEFYDFMKNK